MRTGHSRDTAALHAAQIPRVAAKGKDRVCLVWNHRRLRYGV